MVVAMASSLRRLPPGGTAPSPAVRTGAAVVLRASRAHAVSPGRGLTPDDAHEWISFEDDEEERTWVFDVTFLTSNWNCIFGNGCQGVLTGPAPELVQGCCSYGAHFIDKKDARRVEKAAATLTAEQWQNHGTKKKVIHENKNGEIVTRLVEDACIFLNRPGFAGGVGCALHVAAMKRGVDHMTLKPEVCWQLPLRREDEVDDDEGHVISTIRQWDRRHWGEGGREFHWWCTEAPEAFVGHQARLRGDGARADEDGRARRPTTASSSSSRSASASRPREWHSPTRPCGGVAASGRQSANRLRLPSGGS